MYSYEFLTCDWGSTENYTHANLKSEGEGLAITLDSIPPLQVTNLVPSSPPTVVPVACTGSDNSYGLVWSPDHEEKWSGEPSWISWAIAHFCDNVTWAMIKTFCGQSTQKKLRILEWRSTNFTVVREVLCNNYQSHCSLSLWGNKPKKFDMVHQTVSRQKCAWTGQLN